MVALIERYDARWPVSKAVRDAMRAVPRHEFVPDDVKPWAYADAPLPIGREQTISQPFIVAVMSDLLAVGPGARVLEVGTGSGYQAAVLAVMGVEVYSIEIVPELAARAARTLRDLGYDKVHVRSGDGYRGWPEHAPFDAIIVTCAPDHVPQPLVDQLKTGGRLVIPVGQPAQELILIEKTNSGLERRKVMDVRFVPMTGEAQR